MRLSRLAFAAAVACIAALGAVRISAQAPSVTLVVDSGQPAIVFAVNDIRAALEQRGAVVTIVPPGRLAAQTASVQVVVTTEGVLESQPAVTGLAPQGYAIRRVATGSITRWWAIGHDAPGAMYGGLELAERLRLDGNLERVGDSQVNPHLAYRGIKFNIPLDARTPSYSDDSTSAQANITEMWSMEFWTRYLDEMARHRYNLLSLWSLAPFPSLVRVPEYPDVALADVKKKVGPLFDATLTATGMYDPSWALETVKVMTIDEKIAFWRRVMQYAKDRGIEVSLFTWNIFVHGTEGTRYGITDDPSNPVTKDYFRASVRALFNTYPLLAGLGITSGEHMGDLTAVGKEAWLWETYGRGVADAMAAAQDPVSPFYQPGRVIRLIHRAHQADLASIVSHFSQLPGASAPDSTLAFSFKYSEAHMFASTAPRFIYQRGWFDSMPAGKKTFLTVRNDDMYYLRWGDPDFVRAYIGNLPDLSRVAGFYMGPDGYNWGREFVSRQPGTPRELVIDKMWFSFLLWGRLSYDPSIPDSRFEAILASRFPSVPSRNLFLAWTSVSKVLPLFTRFYWGNLDFRWYPEASWSLDGYESVQNIIDGRYRPMTPDEDGQTPGIMSVRAFVTGEAPAGRRTPLDVAEALQEFADTGLRNVPGTDAGADNTLRQTLGDIRAMAWLGRYYAAKIRGAVALARYQRDGAVSDYADATAHLRTAASHWRAYAEIWSSQYVGQVLTRMGPTFIDIAAVQTFVDADIPAPLAR